MLNETGEHVHTGDVYDLLEGETTDNYVIVPIEDLRILIDLAASVADEYGSDGIDALLKKYNKIRENPRPDPVPYVEKPVMCACCHREYTGTYARHVDSCRYLGDYTLHFG